MSDAIDSKEAVSAALAVEHARTNLVICSVEVIQDSANRSPAGLPLDIVELELSPVGDLYMRFRDKLRFDCERGTADKVIAALGLKAVG